jgi:hypothetical protein
MVNGEPAVNSSPSSGWPIGLPDGSLPVGVNCAEEMAMRPARALAVEKRIVMCVNLHFCSRVCICDVCERQNKQGPVQVTSVNMFKERMNRLAIQKE